MSARRQQQVSLTILIVCMSVMLVTSVAPALASGADFVLTSQGIDLGQPEEAYENNQPQPPRYSTKVELDQPFTLIAQGWVYPRSTDPQVAKGAPCIADDARWRFDDEDFKLLEHDAQQFDKSMTVIRLQPLTIGRTRIRFTGIVLGYKRTFDIIIDIITAKER